MKNEPLKFFMIAGEPSGDIHGANLITEIRKNEPDSSFMGLGGDKMEAAGMKLTHHINVLSVMGFLEVLKSMMDNLPSNSAIQSTRPATLYLSL